MDKELLAAIEAEGWSVRSSMQDGNHLADIAIFSPAGEDFCPTIWYGGGSAEEFIDGLESFIEGYDVDEETYLWLDSSGHGRNGAPYHIKDILEDKEWSLNKMKSLAAKLKEKFINK